MIRTYIGMCILTAAFWGSMYSCTWKNVPSPLGPVDIVIDASTIIGIYNAVYGGDDHFPNQDQKTIRYVPVKSVSKNITPVINDNGPTMGIVPDGKIETIRTADGAWMSESDFKKLYEMSVVCEKPCVFVTSSGDRVKIE